MFPRAATGLATAGGITVGVASDEIRRHGLNEQKRTRLIRAVLYFVVERHRPGRSSATVTPLLGLLGTVIGMIKVFTEIMAQGTGNASALAGGISEALITTAAGLMLAIPAMAMYFYLRGRVVKITEEGAGAHIDKMAKKYLGEDEFPRPPEQVRVLYYIEPVKVTTME